MKKLILSLALLLGLPAAAQVLPLDYFATPAQFSSIKLSPGGDYFAATVPKDDTNVLVVINRSNNKRLIAYGFGQDEYVGDFYWANNERLIYTRVYQTQGYERKAYKGEIYAANIDGSKREQLFGYSKKDKFSSRGGDKAHGYIVSMLPGDDEHILVRASKWNTDRDAPDMLYRVNIYNQRKTRIAQTPVGNISVVTNSDGIPVIAKGKDRDGKTKRFTFADGQWQEIGKDDPLYGYSYLSLSQDGRLLYLSKSVNDGTTGLFQYDFVSRKITPLFQHPEFDINGYVRDPDSDRIVAVEVMHQGMEYHYLDDSPFGRIHKKLSVTFPGADISIRANSSSDNEMVVKVVTDKSPGDFYLYRADKGTLDYLLSTKPWIYPEDMADRTLVHFNARDGQKIHGYLTLPTSGQKPFPLIVDVHGGPYGVQDGWQYDASSQMWANNGFAVLQINFRGSGGFGNQFEETAYLRRSTLIQHDIIDGTRWALARPEISDTQVCITGGSFGGYSALMSPLIEPELYRCAIPMFGAYDLLYQMKHADYMDGSSVSVSAMKKYGDNEEHWRKESPMTYLDKLNTPLMIVTGGRDTRVPPENAMHLKAALDERNISYEWLYKPSEGHGFVNKDNKVELFQKSLDFVRKHLKP
ncbi:prolyl oligopeptidase family serine peptidase [Shewanella sp. GXUN23E]|uniref:alpha/beta hydrolase family protein n=1 Tax=Shewanella sp. GXUN23E TaxID=3422498 RepID=UPI003D7E9A7C